MIVPGEASESDEDDLTLTSSASRGQTVETATEAHETTEVTRRPQPQPRSNSLQNRLSLTLTSAASAVSRIGETLARSTLDGEIENYEGKSLLHQKLFDKNRELRSKVSEFEARTVVKGANDLEVILAGSERTQEHFRETVLAMQQANHFTAESIESMDDFVKLAAVIKFPNVA